MLELSAAATALDGQLIGADARFSGVTTDSRQMRTGDLLVAIRGERFDGHRFVADALRSGAAGAIVDRESLEGIEAGPLIVVSDTRLALGRLAAHWRGQWRGVLIGVTGSNGKTTVKEMIAAILRAHAGTDAVLATAGNLNNDIGMPLMLLRLRATHCYAVIEMGMNHLGEIAYLTGLAKPHLALINNAGTAHIGEVGSREGIASAKAEIFQGLDDEGVAIINADDAFAPFWRTRLGTKRVVSFALQAKADVTANVDTFAPIVEMQLTYGTHSLRVTLSAPGRHNAMNALAASAVALALDIPGDAVSRGLASYQGVKGRLQTRKGTQGETVIDDTYNANPDSVKAAIDVLTQSRGRRILVMGDLGELGDLSAPLHREVGAVARAARIERLFTLGEASEATCNAFGKGARHFRDIGALLHELRSAITARSTVLVKGSRFMRMERVVEALCADSADIPGRTH